VRKAKKETVLLIRSVKEDMTSTNGFVWPKSGTVACPDWKDNLECGNGLHGLLPGQNDPSTWYSDGPILVLEVDVSSIKDLDGECKFPECEVVYCGDMKGACAFAETRGVYGPWYRGTAIAGDSGTATAGDGGTATAGDGGTATAGYRGTAIAGDGGTAIAGDSGNLVVKIWDGNRYRFTIGYVGENGIKSNTKYRLDGKGNFVEVVK